MNNRQEIAARLRETGEWFKNHQADIRYMACHIKQIISPNSTLEYQDVFSRLADLVDPTCRIYYTDTSTSTPDTGYEPDGYYSCSCCGELDDCFQEMWDDYQAKGYEGEPPFRYCPHCGARVVRDEA